MAMETGGSFLDFSVKQQNYSSYPAQNMTESSAEKSTERKKTGKTAETAEGSKPKNTAEYMRELSKLVPSAECRVGNTFASAKNGITLTINPQLLEEMQNNPEKEREMKELIKGVEAAVNMLESINKASGWTVVYKHCYIDENGKFRSVAYLRNDFMLKMSDKLREERKKNAEKLLERQKEKAAERLLKEKIANSKDGMIYLYDTDLKSIMETAKDSEDGKADKKGQVQAGTNLDLQV